MTSLELEKLIKDRLTSADLSQYIDERKEQYLEFPDGFFAEIVLKDGSRLAAAQRIMKGVKEELRREDIDLDVIVRATWKIIDVSCAGPAIGTSGGVKAATRFIAILGSGDSKCEVIVDVSNCAYDFVLKKLSEEKITGLSNGERQTAIIEIITSFLQFELSLGGESYWDPILHPQRDLNEAAVQYIMLHPSAKAS